MMDDKQWVRDRTAEGYILGILSDTDGQPTALVVLQTIDGTAVIPRSRVIPVDPSYMIRSLSQRFEDLIRVAEQAGYTPTAIQAAIDLARGRQFSATERGETTE
jgi:hypothetical protein